MKVKFKLLKAGYCIANLNHALHKAESKIIRFYAAVGLIFHPTKGIILFDTGYTTDFYEATKKFPYSIYAKATKVFIKQEEEIISQLKQMDINATDVKHVIVSHFHADHICALKHFKNAKFICNKVAYDNVKNKKGILAVKKGFIPTLLPSFFEDNAEFLDFKLATETEKDLGNTIDLFNDGTIKLCNLTGHAKGQIGAIINSENDKVFMLADAAWLKPNYQKMHLPNPIIKLFIDSWKDYKTNLTKVHNYHINNPLVKIIPSHCLETLNEFTNNNA